MRSLNVVLLHVGNKRPSISIAQSAQLKEFYDNIKILLNVIHYSDYQWNLCGYLKIVGMLMELQREFTKHFYFYVCLTVMLLHNTMKQKNGQQGIYMYWNKKYSTHSFSKSQ